MVAHSAVTPRPPRRVDGELVEASSMRAVVAAILLLCSCVGALRVSVPRRQVLASALSAAALVGPGALPALAKSKTSVNPNKQCNDVTDPYGNVVSMCSGAKKKETTTELYKQQKASMSGDKVRTVGAPSGTDDYQRPVACVRARRLVMGRRGSSQNDCHGRPQLSPRVSTYVPPTYPPTNSDLPSRPPSSYHTYVLPTHLPQGSRGTELDKDFTKLETERRTKTKTAPKQANRNPMSVKVRGERSSRQVPQAGS